MVGVSCPSVTNIELGELQTQAFPISKTVKTSVMKIEDFYRLGVFIVRGVESVSRITFL